MRTRRADARGTALRVLVGATMMFGVSALVGSSALADPAADRPQNTAEIQVGGGAAFEASNKLYPLVQVHARFSMWRTIGFGAYAAGVFVLDGGPNRTIVPVCARFNLSLPFWRTLEPMGSLGLGGYWTRTGYASGTRSSFTPGGHLALALLFTGEKRGFGLELAGHAWGDGSGEVETMGTVAATVLFR